MSFFTTSFRVPFPKAQLKEDNDEQIRNLLDAGIYPARLVGMRRGGVRALYGEKIAISPGTRCKCNTVAADQHTATATGISRSAAKSGCACEWGGWGRISEDGSGQNNPNRNEGPGGKVGHTHSNGGAPKRRVPRLRNEEQDALNEEVRRMEANRTTRRPRSRRKGPV